jgi:hypothetical protein
MGWFNNIYRETVGGSSRAGVGELGWVSQVVSIIITLH